MSPIPRTLSIYELGVGETPYYLLYPNKSKKLLITIQDQSPLKQQILILPEFHGHIAKRSFLPQMLQG